MRETVRQRETAAAPGLVKSDRQLVSMRDAGRIAADALRRATSACRPGAATAEIDAIVRDTLAERGAEVLFEGYRQGDSPPFTGACCISINEEVVHGVPGDRTLRPGDLVTVDVGLRLRPEGDPDGWCADAARSVIVPGEDESGAPARARREDAEELLETTREALRSAIEMMRPGLAWSDVARMMERLAAERGFGVVDEYVGHGLGRELHEPPQAPACLGSRSFKDFTLRAGMTLAVEPILTVASPRRAGVTEVTRLPDGWTVTTADASLACHEEDTVAITPDGAVALTAGEV